MPPLNGETPRHHAQKSWLPSLNRPDFAKTGYCSRCPTVNGLAYLKRIEATMLTVSQLGQNVIIPNDRFLNIQDFTKREDFDYAFDFRSEIFEAPYSDVWKAIKLTLKKSRYKLQLEDKNRGLFSTNLVSDGSGLANSIKIYGQIYPVTKFSDKAVNWTKIKFKQFVFRERSSKVISPGKIKIKFFPNYDLDTRQEKARKFLQDIRSRLRGLS
jgi:hypothetical protein